MKPRTREYLDRKKAFQSLPITSNLKDMLVAEYNSSKNIIVKKDILKMIDQLEKGDIVVEKEGE